MATPRKVMQETLIQTSSSNLATLLKIPTENKVLDIWQTRVIGAIDAFLNQTKIEVHSLILPTIMISYAPDENNIEASAHLLEYCFQTVGLRTTLCSLSNTQTLESQLKQNTYAVVLCTPEYAKRVEEEPAIRVALDFFGRTKKNALQPLLCDGGFRNTALKIVDGHYLIRSYQAALKKEPLSALPTFTDIFFNLSGNQGLGILPDILDLKETPNITVESTYRKTFSQLHFLQQQATIDYHLQTALAESAQNHPLQQYLDSNTLPVVKDTAGFQPLIQELVTSTAKVSLVFCQTKADVALTGLALTQNLMAQKTRVLSIECSDYPGKLAGDCVRLVLQKMKCKTADIDAIKQEPLLILLKGYENIGAYDNLWVKNKLSTWTNVKLLVTCRADFFKFRGYLSCFLSDVSNRQVDDLLVYKIPSFASLAAQKASLSLTQPPEILDAAEMARLNPKRAAEQIELTIFLKNLNQLWVKQGYLSSSLQQNPQLFISYAWEADKDALGYQQLHLSQLSQDLTTLGFPTWLDIERMSGDIDEQMTGNIANSQAVVVIQTPRYTERSQQDTNVKKEFDAIIQKSQTNPDFRIFPLQFLIGSIPPALDNHPNQCDFTDIDENYLTQMTHPSFGLIPKLLLDTPVKKELYQNVYAAFQDQCQLLVGKYLLVNQAQDDIQAYDIDNRLKGYIEPYGIYSETSSLDKRFDLNQYFQSFLDNPDARAAVVLGRAGSGKSLFALSTFKTFLQQWHEYRNNAAVLPVWLPVYIQLRNHAKDPENCIENALRQFLSVQDINSLKQGLNHHQQFLFILDGYDELGSGVYPNLSQSLNEWPLAKLLITGRPEYFDKDHPPLETLSLTSPEGKIILNSAEVVYVSPFSPDEIKRYVDFYTISKQKDVNKAIDENDYETLQNLPGMMALLDNPFLLTLVLQALPQLLKNRQGIETTVTRAGIYQAFTETWFLQETKGRELDPKDCEAFSQDLAFRFFQFKTISVSHIPEKQALWDFFKNEAHQAAQDASPLRFSGGEYSFVHKSIYEYFVAARLWKAIPNPDCLTLWQTRLLIEERPVIDFLAEFYHSSSVPHIQVRLFELIEGSKNKNFPAVASSNAITVLNAAKVSFSARNFNGIHIPGADLTGAILDDTNLQNTDLTDVHLQSAWLRRTNFTGADLTGVQFGERPHLLQENGIQSVAYSPDGRWIVAGSENDIILWDAVSYERLRVLKGHTHIVTSIAFSPDGLMLASGSCDNTLKIWSVASSELIRTLMGHTDQVHGIAFSPDGLMLVSGGKDSTVKLWNVTNGEVIRTLTGHTDQVRSIAISPDGLTLASGDLYNTIKIWNVANGELIRSLKDLNSTVNSLAFSPDGLTLASGSSELKFWSVAKGELTRTFIHAGTVVNITFSPDGLTLASADGDKTIKLWSVASGELMRTLIGHSDYVSSIAFSPDGLTLASGSSDKTLKLWNVANSGLMRPSIGHTSQVISIAISPDGLILASGSYDKTIKLWNVASGELTHTLIGHHSHVTSIAFSSEGLTLASADGDKTIKFWNVASGKLIRSVEDHAIHMNSVAISPDGLMVVLAGQDETLKLWNIVSGEVTHTLIGHHSHVTSVIFSPDGLTLASGGIDTTVKLWSVVSGKLICTLEGHTSTVDSLVFSPDGLMLASGGFDNTVKLWSIVDGELAHTLEGHTAMIDSLAFSPDGLMLASGSRDNTLKLWDITTGQLLATLSGYLDAVSSIAWQQDTLVTGSSDKSVKCWKIQRNTDSDILSCTLLWSSHVSLYAEGCQLNQALLTPLNTRLLKQKGAKGYTRILAHEHPDWNDLHLATANNHQEQIIQVLQEQPNLLDSQTLDGETSLHIAIRYQAIEALEYLLRQGANSWLCNPQGQRPRGLAVDLGQKELLTYLPYEDTEHPENTPLHLAIQNNNEGVVACLLKQQELGKFYCDINAPNHQDETPLVLALATHNIQIVELLLEKGVNLHQKNRAEETAAHIAASNNQVEILKLLKKWGADLLAKGNYGDTPLHNAAANNKLEALEWLLNQGISVDSLNTDGETSAHIAVIYNCLDALKQLKNWGANLLAKGVLGATPLHIAAANNQIEILKWLLEQRIPIDILQDDSCTPLHLAADNGQKETVELLLQRGANFFALNNNGKTPLQLAQEKDKKENIECIEKFILAASVAQKLSENEKIHDEKQSDILLESSSAAVVENISIKQSIERQKVLDLVKMFDKKPEIQSSNTHLPAVVILSKKQPKTVEKGDTQNQYKKEFNFDD